MKKPIILCYTKASKGVRALQRWLQNNGLAGIKRTSNVRRNRFVINWGCSKQEEQPSCFYLNRPSCVADSINKLKTFNILFGTTNIPGYTTDKDEAQQWIDDGNMVVGRKTLVGHSGAGIVLFNHETITSNLECPLYVQYKKKRKEYRIHVFNGGIIDIQQKKKRAGGVASSYIRSHANGWVFCRELDFLPNDATTQAIEAVNALGLHFGAVDVIWNEQEDKSYVLEVNTAPGLENTTVEKYGQAFKELLSVQDFTL